MSYLLSLTVTSCKKAKPSKYIWLERCGSNGKVLAQTMLVLADNIYFDPELFSAFSEKNIEECSLQGY